MCVEFTVMDYILQIEAINIQRTQNHNNIRNMKINA